MEPEPEPVDLSALDPKRDAAQFERTVSAVAARALELRRLRRRVLRRGVPAVAFAMAAGLLLWLSAPRRAVEPARASDLLDWVTRDVGANDVLELGDPHAH